MACQEQYSGFIYEVCSKLRSRNENERERFEDVINLSTSLYEQLDFHQKENLRLRVRNLEQDVDLQKNSDSGSSKLCDRASIDKKVLLLQEEIGDLHKQKGEFAMQVLNLRNAMDEKEKEIVSKNTQIEELEGSLANSELLCKRLLKKLSETEHNLQFIKDEHDALRITYSSIEDKRQKLEKENRDLIARLIELKAEDADRLNAETEMIQRLLWPKFLISK